MSPSAIPGPETARGILTSACEAKEMLFLVTPYLKYESNFLRLEGEELHVRVTMGVEEANFGLRTSDLVLRFPHATRFLQGRTRMLGFGLQEGRRTLRLELPKSLQDDEMRAAYRVERVGRVGVTFSTERFDIASGYLVNLSTTGAKLTAQQDFEDQKLGSLISVSIPLSEEVRINSRCRILWAHGRSLGVEFHPTLPEAVLTPLTRWIFRKREEDRDIQARGPAAGMTRPGPLTGGVVLVSGSPELEALLRAGWAELPPLRRVGSAAQQLKEALAAGPDLLLFHLPGAGLDDRRRLRGLVENLGGRTPFVLLGTGVETDLLYELGTELKAASAVSLAEKPSPLFFRLLQGILRRHRDEA
jgi:hypothetical protein